MTSVQIEKLIMERCKCWWDMTIDADWEQVLLNKDTLEAYVLNFQEWNDKYILSWDKQLWIQVKTILNDLAVALDVEQEEEFERWSTCFQLLWDKVEQVSVHKR